MCPENLVLKPCPVRGSPQLLSWRPVLAVNGFSIQNVSQSHRLDRLSHVPWPEQDSWHSEREIERAEDCVKSVGGKENLFCSVVKCSYIRVFS